MEFVKCQEVSLRELNKNEAWLESLIVNDPSILGLGELLFEGRQVTLSSGGRVDLILVDQDTEPETEYLVEPQLGATDPSHIVRAIEYWDLRRRVTPHRKHCAVLVAEEITGRFYNVINLIKVPIIAIEFSALKCNCGGRDFFTIVFNTVYDNFSSSQESSVNRPADREYWVRRSSECTMRLIDCLIVLINRVLNKNFQPNYNQHYVGLKEGGRTTAFISFYPRKRFVRMNFRLPRKESYDKKIEEAGITYSYDQYFKLYSLKIECPNPPESMPSCSKEAPIGNLPLPEEVLELLIFLIKEAAYYAEV